MDTDEIEIHAIIDKQVIAIKHKDFKDALSTYSEEVVSFDVIDPLQYSGLKEVRKRLVNWFSTFQDTIEFEITDLKVTASGKIGFSHGLNHISAKTIDGAKLDMFYRQTLCFAKVNGAWLITHAHSSVPFNTDSGKASLDLKP